jgi:hypothetical protein
MRFLILLLLAVIMSSCSVNTLSKKEIDSMKAQYKLQYGKNPDIWPVMVGLKEDMTNIFSVPIENAVGTNSINDAITLLRFKDDEVEYDEVKRSFVDGVGIGDKFYPEMFNGLWIGYTQTRGFLLFNFKEKNGIRYMPQMTGDEYYTGVKTFDESKLQFVFQKLEEYWPEGIRHLQLLEFHPDGTFKTLAEMKAGAHEIGYVEPWAIQNKTLFVYRNDSIKINAYNQNFQQIQHPFCELFNGLDKFQCLDQLTMHPTAPVAIVVEMDKAQSGDYWVYLACWQNKDPQKQFIELLGQDISMFSEWRDLKGLKCSHFEFSPDGKWLVFRDDSEMVLQDIANPTFVAMPVDVEREMPLGKPKLLGKVMRENAQPASTAWITKPLSFVVSDGQVLYKWEIDNLKREFKD